MSNMGLNNIEELKIEIRHEEGVKLNDEGLHIVYKGPKTGKPHCCYGHLLGQQQSEEELKVMGLEDEPEDWFAAGLTFNDSQAEELLDIDIADAIEGLHSSKRYPGWTEQELLDLDPQRFIGLINMAFQLGGPGVRMKFPSFVQAVHAQDWNRAADEMLWSNGLLKQKRSQWYLDTPDRCQLMSDKMRHGTQNELNSQNADIDSADGDEQEFVRLLSRNPELQGFSDHTLLTELYVRQVIGLKLEDAE